MFLLFFCFFLLVGDRLDGQLLLIDVFELILEQTEELLVIEVVEEIPLFPVMFDNTDLVCIFDVELPGEWSATPASPNKPKSPLESKSKKLGSCSGPLKNLRVINILIS